MSGTSSVSGLASGLDWATIVEQLIEVEHERVDLVEDQKTEYEEQLTAWEEVETYLDALETAAEALQDADDFYTFISSLTTDNTSVNGEDLLSVSTTSDASPGSYTIEITSLAQAQKLSSNPFTSKNTELGDSYAGDIIINGQVITISSSDTLSDVASAINNTNTGTNPTGVTASVVSYGDNDYRLVLTSDDTGADGISLLNGSSSNLVQKFGWKDQETAVVKNSITNGAQSDLFSSTTVAIQSLLGLTTGESGTIEVDGESVAVDLSSDSLTDIKDAINTAMEGAGKENDVVASVISVTDDEGTTYYRLQIEGTTDFTDDNNILNTLGVLDNNSATITAANTEVSDNSMTSDGDYITPDTLLVDIDGYISLDAGNDMITFSGTDTEGNTVNYEFTITSSTTVQDLLDAIEDSTNGYAAEEGDVVAYITSDGKIRVEDVAAGGSLNVILSDSITNGELEFVDGDGAFGDGTARKREIVAGQDAVLEIDGVEVTKDSNTIDDVITGVTLNLLNADDETTVTLTIDYDTETLTNNIQSLVDAYNSIMSYISTQFTYDDEEESTGGVLFGDSTLHSVKNDLIAAMTETVWGVDSDFSSLSLIGITSERNDDDIWELVIDEDELSDALESNFTDVVALFTAQGSTSTTNLTFISETSDTADGEYQVNIDTVATQSTSTSDTAVDTTLGSDETLTITNGTKTATIELTASMSIDDIVNTVNTELDSEYTQTIVGDNPLYSDETLTTVLTAETTWDSIYDDAGQLSFSSEDTISFSGTDRSGTIISGSYTISDSASDTVQDLLAAIEEAFSDEVNATIDTSGRIVITDKYVGSSEVSLSSVSHSEEGEFFGTVDVDSSGDDGSSTGRYAIAITASASDDNELVLTYDEYGSSFSFTISESDDLLWTGGDQSVDNGTDVAGTIGGESATGEGQVLTGDDDNTSSAGLSVRYTGTTTGTNVGTVTITHGVAELLDRALYSITDTYDGYVTYKQDSLQNRIDELEDKIEEMETRLDKKQETLLAKFTAMELALSTLQNQSDWLSSQIEALS